jgi:hypothetical protein
VILIVCAALRCRDAAVVNMVTTVDISYVLTSIAKSKGFQYASSYELHVHSDRTAVRIDLVSLADGSAAGSTEDSLKILIIVEGLQ